MPSMVSAVQTWSQYYGYRVAHLVTLINIQTLQEFRVLPTIALTLPLHCLFRGTTGSIVSRFLIIRSLTMTEDEGEESEKVREDRDSNGGKESERSRVVEW